MVKKKEDRKKNIVGLIVSCIIAIICLPLFLINIFIIVDSCLHPEEIPSFMGYKPFIVYSGSMEKEIPVGSIAIIKEIDPDSLKKRDIIAFKCDDGSVVTHRIIKIKEKNENRYYVTKGDQNSSVDQYMVSNAMIEGKYLFNIAYLGYFAMFLKEPLGLVSVLLGIALCFMIYLFIAEKSKNTQNV